MAILFAASEADAFLRPGGGVGANTSTGFDPDYSRCSMAMSASSSAVATAPVGGQDELWVHFRLQTSASLTSGVFPLTIRTASGDILFRLRLNAQSPGYVVVSGYHTSASSLTEISPGSVIGGGVVINFDVHVKMVATNQALVELFMNGLAVSSATVTSTWLGTKKPNTVELNGASGFGLAYLSEIIITNSEDTRGWRLATLAPNGNGASGDWTGSYVDVDEIGAADDNDFISSDTAGQIELMTLSNLSPVAQNMTPVAVSLATRARVGAGGPQNIQPGLRTGSADFFASNIPGLVTDFSNSQQVWAVNPATSSPWSIADIQNLEAGYKSVA